MRRAAQESGYLPPPALNVPPFIRPLPGRSPDRAAGRVNFTVPQEFAVFDETAPPQTPARGIAAADVGARPRQAAAANGAEPEQSRPIKALRPEGSRFPPIFHPETGEEMIAERPERFRTHELEVPPFTPAQNQQRVPDSGGDAGIAEGGGRMPREVRPVTANTRGLGAGLLRQGAPSDRLAAAPPAAPERPSQQFAEAMVDAPNPQPAQASQDPASQTGRDKSKTMTGLQGLTATLANEARLIAEDRQKYGIVIARAAREIRDDLIRRGLTPKAASSEAFIRREVIIDDARKEGTALGKRLAEFLAKKKDFEIIQQGKATRLFQKDFRTLTPRQKVRVWAEVVESSGRSNPSVSKFAKTLGPAAKGLLVVTMAMATYNVLKADDKVQAAAREILTIGGGMGGGTLGGKLGSEAGARFGRVLTRILGAARGGAFLGGRIGASGGLVVAAFGVIVGGTIGALMTEFAFDRTTDFFE